MKVCFLGGSRYTKPLDLTSAKKFVCLKSLGDIFVIGFSADMKFRIFTEEAHFILFPQLPFALMRYLEISTLGFLITIIIILRYGVTCIIAQSPFEGFVAALVKYSARLCGKQVALIVESHGDFEVSLFLQRRVSFPQIYRYFMRQVAHFAIRHADVLRAVSNSTRQQLEVCAPGKPIYQFPAWTDMEVFLGESASKKKNSDERLILFVGVLIPRKGIHFLIDAFAKVVQVKACVKLIIIGKADNPEYAEGLKVKVKHLDLDGLVTFLGPVPQRELAKNMAQADVLVLPSLSEALGRVVFEAMACGTPVIGSCVGGIAEMVSDGVTGFLVPPGAVESLKDRLLWILYHPQEVFEMGRRAREWAEKFFSAESYLSSYIQLVDKAKRTFK